MYVSSMIYGQNITQQYDYFQASLPADESVYGSYLVGPIRVNISKVQTTITTSDLAEAALPTTSAVAGNSVGSFGNPQTTTATFSISKVVT
jgi:hypothetical protein